LVGAGVGAFAAHEHAAYELGTSNDAGYYLYGPLTSLCAVALVALVALPSAAGTRSRVVGVLDSRVVAGVGLVSYSLFLAHAPLIDWLQAHNATFGGHSGFTLTLLVVFAASLAVATASYFMVERPALQWRARAPRATANARAG